MSVFKGFDFQSSCGVSPLTEVIDDVLIQPYLRQGEREGESGVLLPLPCQTGIGKTYTALHTVLREMLWQIQASDSVITDDESEKSFKKRTVIYITDSVDNVFNSFNDLLEQIKGDTRFNNEQKQFLTEQVCYLPRQSSQLMECSPENIDKILTVFDLDNDRAIKNEWNSFNVLNAEYERNNNGNDVLHNLVEEKGRQLYSKIVNRIQLCQRGTDPIALTEKQQLLLDELIPGCRFERGDAHVLFMTTKKYLAGFHHSKGKYRPLRDTKGQLLIIDEVDKQNGVILSAMVDKRAQDLIRAVRSLRANLNSHHLENSIRYSGIEDIFDPLREELIDFANRWNLEYAYDTEGNTLADHPVRLFSDRTFTHSTYTKKALLDDVDASNVVHQLKLECDINRKKNIITVCEKKIHSGEQSYSDSAVTAPSLVKFVNETDRVYQHFFQAMRKSVQRYIKNIENLPLGKREDRSATGSYQEAVQSILAHYNLQDFTSSVFEAFDAQSLERKSSPSLPARRSYHRNGLKLVDITQNEGTRDTVACHFYGMSQSPTGLLADIVESGAIVVGVSATANASTVIHNFDMAYLRDRLGQSLVELSSMQCEKIHNYYVSKRDYTRNGVSIDVAFLKQSDPFLNVLLREWKPRGKIELILQTMLNVDTEGTSFLRGWLAKLLQSIERFVKAGDGRYMLALCNRTLSVRKSEQLMKFITFCVKKWSLEANVEVTLFDGIDAKAMRDGRYQKVLNYLENNNGKVVVLSTYSSMGAGKNPDYRVNPSHETLPFHYVGTGEPECEHNADIDSLYLEKPTHLLLTEENAVPNRLTLFHQIMSLQECGDISPKQTTGWSYAVLTNVPGMEHLNRYYQTADYQSAVRKYIEQAVGRTGRTAYKRKTIRLMVDAEMIDILATDERESALLSQEYVALVDKARSVGVCRVSDRLTRRIHNLAARNNKDSALMMKELVNRLHRPGNVNIELDIALWEGMREQLLKWPTLITPWSEWPRLYLQLPSVNNEGGLMEPSETGSAHYRYDGDPDKRLDNFEFFDRVKTGKLVSEINSDLPKLLKNTVVKQYFELHGFATDWGSDQWVMTPVMFTNIYRAALAEQACKALLKDNGFLWQEMPPAFYERFDAQIQYSTSKALLDVKFWKSSSPFDEATKTKIRAVTNHMAIQKVVYINVMGLPEEKVRYRDVNTDICSPQEAVIIEVPGLIDELSGALLEDNLHTLMGWVVQESTEIGMEA